MLQRDPSKRPALPITIMNALLPFTTAMKPASMEVVRQQKSAQHRRPVIAATGSVRQSPESLAPARFDHPPRVLLVDDESSVRNLGRAILQPLGYVCEDAADAKSALQSLQQQPCDLVLLDLNLPDLDGYEICRRLREHPVQPHLKIIIVSGRGDKNQLADALPLGADDFIAKPFGARELIARAEHALRLKLAQDQADALARQLVLTNSQLENSLSARSTDVRRAQDALLFAMAKMAESRDGETSDHLRRLQRYARCLAEQVSDAPNWAGVVNSNFLEQLERCVPLHDIGKMALPESVLLKPGKLTAEERRLMETHTLIGDHILESLGKEHGQSLAFLGMASSIVRHHHERYDGTGYPDRLCGDEIPAAARLLALADVYDALRRRRQHKPALPHSEAVKILLEASPGQFDPYVVQAFAARQHDFERIFREVHT
jgi:putative two-component system response regulator